MYFSDDLHKSLAWITAAVVLGLTFPFLVQEGMFMDAVLYTSVAHNMAEGLGSFWFPYFPFHNTDDVFTFHEQPPLGFGIQSLFFLAFGGSIYVERFYVLVCLGITVYLIRMIFKEMAPTSGDAAWYPILLWISIPLVFWSFQNNMHENTMGIFILLASLSLIRAMRRNSWLVWSLVGAICIAAAVLTKGVPGLFPLVIPPLYFVIFRAGLSRTWKVSSLLFFGLLGIALALFVYPPSHESLGIYIEHRLLKRIANAPIVDYRAYSLVRLGMEILVPLAIMLAIWIVGKKADLRTLGNKGPALFLFALGLCGIVPLMLTYVQRGFYMVPALPFIALGMAVFTLPHLEAALDYLAKRSAIKMTLRLASRSAIIIVLIIGSLQLGKAVRHDSLIADVKTLGKMIPEKGMVYLSPELRPNWSLRTYLMRYFMIASIRNEPNKFILTAKHSDWPIPNGYISVEVPLEGFTLYANPSKAVGSIPMIPD